MAVWKLGRHKRGSREALEIRKQVDKGVSPPSGLAALIFNEGAVEVVYWPPKVRSTVEFFDVD